MRTILPEGIPLSSGDLAGSNLAIDQQATSPSTQI